MTSTISGCGRCCMQGKWTLTLELRFNPCGHPFRGCRAVQRSKQWEGVLTWAEADGHNPWNTHFRVFRWLVAPCTALPACTALLRAEWSVWPSQMHLCLRVGRAEFYYPILCDPTIETQQSSYGVNGSPLAARSGVRAGYSDRGLCRSSWVSCGHQALAARIKLQKKATICCTIAFVTNVTRPVLMSPKSGRL